LDTFTLRKLQKFIDENGDKSDKKKRGPLFDEPIKRAKKPKKDGNGKGAKTSVNTAFAVRPAQVDALDTSPSNHYSIDDNLLNDDSADLLFAHEDEDFSGEYLLFVSSFAFLAILTKILKWISATKRPFSPNSRLTIRNVHIVFQFLVHYT